MANLAKVLNRDNQEVADLVRAAQNLSDAECKNIEGWTDLIRRGQQIPDVEVNKAASIVKKMDSAVAGQPRQLLTPATEQAGKAAEKATEGPVGRAGRKE